MKDYQTHPDPSCYGIETRDGQSVDDYIAKARGFATKDAFIEYRSASPERKAEMRRDRNRDNTSADDSDYDRRRTLEFLKASK
jgi:hypothetical protein